MGTVTANDNNQMTFNATSEAVGQFALENWRGGAMRLAHELGNITQLLDIIPVANKPYTGFTISEDEIKAIRIAYERLRMMHSVLSAAVGR